MDIVVDESGVVDIVVYMLYYRVVDIVPHRLCQPHGIVDVVIDKGGVMNVGGEPSGIVDGVVDKQGVILRAVDIAGVVDVVVDIGCVMHILVYVGNQRVVDIIVDICRVVYVVVDVCSITHNLCDICCIVDNDRVANEYRITTGKIVGNEIGHNYGISVQCQYAGIICVAVTPVVEHVPAVCGGRNNCSGCRAGGSDQYRNRPFGRVC